MNILRTLLQYNAHLVKDCRTTTHELWSHCLPLRMNGSTLSLITVYPNLSLLDKDESLNVELSFLDNIEIIEF